MTSPKCASELGSSQAPLPSNEHAPLVLLPDLGRLAEEIRQSRPYAVVIGNQEVVVDYRVNAGTGAEYAAIDVAFPEPWFAELDPDGSAFEVLGQIWSVCLALD